MYVRSNDGREFIDCASAAFNLILGYGHPEVTAVIKEQVEDLIHATSSLQTATVNAMVLRRVKCHRRDFRRVCLRVTE